MVGFIGGWGPSVAAPGGWRNRCATRPLNRRWSVSMSSGQVMDGKMTSETVRSELSAEVEAFAKRHNGKIPGLAVVIVGTRKDSQTYVRNKRKACEKVGMQSFLFELPEDVSQEHLEGLVDELNQREDVHGILVQLPLPDHIVPDEVLDAIKLEKDVDGFHPLNMGRLCMNGRDKPLFIPCTPKGCMELLDRYGVDVSGKNAVVLGRSNIVGLPVSMLLMQRNATVTVCHSRTTDVAAKVAAADVVVAAVGRAEMVKGEWIKPGATVIDVGINAVDDPSAKRGYRLVGDVEYEAAKERAALITPVPGGVGPMTIAMLLRNTLDAARMAEGESVQL